MFANKRNIENNGPNAVNNTGDGATFEINYNYTNTPKRLNRTYLYEFCVGFSEVDDSPADYNTERISGIEEKMGYNEIELYKKIFFECDYYIDDVEIILKGIPRRQRILSKISFMYQRFKKFENWENKDELCERVYSTLFEMVENDSNSSEMFLEDAELAIHALMYYAFTKCKLLDPLPKKENGC
ncbi:hypothetical protein [Bacillus cereus]|uniref:hypothetical protein n=1 Tax=Bacillus cereus TaxID=1396 RepID=UPI000BECEE89|nr:hypothetical protein [Bacillus cereus]PEC81957.1 hypothetical protein CON28_29040 [Bacillus cereus]